MNTRRLEGRKIALMLDHEYQELEVWYPYYRLIEEGAEVTRVAPAGGVIYQVVPEPATLAMLAIGGLALMRRRK